MANLNGNGIPEKSIIGAVGDIYTDNTTKKKYECIFAYRSDSKTEFDCQWKELNSISEKQKTPYVKHTESEQSVKTVETPESEPLNRKNYTNYNKGKMNNGKDFRE